MPLKHAIRAIDEFFKLEIASSIILLTAAISAMLAINIDLFAPYYVHFINIPLQVSIKEFDINKPLLLWINDGLMAIFFLLVGLELKREILEGQLSKLSQVMLPIIAAIGGMLVPALIYSAFNWSDANTLQGWAIPSATDIAFSLGVLALLGSRIPISLKIFLMALAIIDDLGAIIIIALFYSGHHLESHYLLLAMGVIILLGLLNFAKIQSVIAYSILGVFLWVFVLKSGVHATLAGVTLAAFIPLRVHTDTLHSPLHRMEHALHPWVAFLIMPIFAFANAGVSFDGLSLSSLTEAVPLGIILGLFLGKLIGVLIFSWIIIKLGYAQLPEGANWQKMAGIALLCGIGFTMSLFIGSLAFTTEYYMNQVRLGVILGSLLSAVAGYLILYRTTLKH